MGSRGKSLLMAARRAVEKLHKKVSSASFEKISEGSSEENLFSDLMKAEIKFSKSKTKFITRDKTGKITWLEEGNNYVGLTHIIQKHASPFEKALGVKKADIPNHIKEVIENGIIVRSKLDNGGTNRKYLYEGNYYTVIVTASNGFIITAYPERKEKK